ncbi:MAG: hypothetical protein JNN07_26270 [Verrucomicrobiales bacterium]|nr:hypothetical protein [Verrucomicrobiales bacterium]
MTNIIVSFLLLLPPLFELARVRLAAPGGALLVHRAGQLTIYIFGANESGAFGFMPRLP